MVASSHWDIIDSSCGKDPPKLIGTFLSSCHRIYLFSRFNTRQPQPTVCGGVLYNVARSRHCFVLICFLTPKRAHAPERPSPTYDEAKVQNWLRKVREVRERSSHTISDIEASLQSRSPEYALYIIVQCLSQVSTDLEGLSCRLIAHLHVLLDRHRCQLWYRNGNDKVDWPTDAYKSVRYRPSTKLGSELGLFPYA